MSAPFLHRTPAIHQAAALAYAWFLLLGPYFHWHATEVHETNDHHFHSHIITDIVIGSGEDQNLPVVEEAAAHAGLTGDAVLCLAVAPRPAGESDHVMLECPACSPDPLPETDARPAREATTDLSPGRRCIMLAGNTSPPQA